VDGFLRYFYQDMGRIFSAFVDVIVDFFNFLNYLLNFPMRMKIIEEYNSEFDTTGKILMLVANIALIVVIVLLFILFGKLMKRIFRFRVPVKKYDEMVKKVTSLQRDLIRANYEKDKILALKVAELGLDPSQVNSENFLNSLYGTENGSENPEEKDAKNSGGSASKDSEEVTDASESRFFRLTSVDNYYKTEYVAPVYNDDINLVDFCTQFRLFAASQLHLYYEIRLIRHFVASLGAARIVILQGISGTGKTSLPYAFGKFVQKDSAVISVQPAWRERTELYGYYNEFTKKYTETDFLRTIYEANYFRDPQLMILDEMNIARVEYYFAEMLSILEMPRVDEWKIDIVTAVWDNDPVLIHEGKVQIPDNVWFIGTINNDDSTFAVADKVYDRAIPIDLDTRAEAFECDLTDPIYVSTDHLNALFTEAKQKYSISDEVMEKLEDMNKYLIDHFRLAFGNRIMRQLKDYVPCYMACGGTELEAVDFMVAKKVLRKFESLNLGFMKEELSQFNSYLDKLFGKDVMAICKDYVEYLKKNN
jgi:hypothetical protein